MIRARIVLCLLAVGGAAGVQAETSVQYLANEGVMVTHEDTKVLFDPLYNNSYGRYQMVPAPMRAAIFAGDAPYDNVDAVFVSHHHGDHFSAEDMLRLLREQAETRLYAPAQAVTEIRKIATANDESVLERLTGLDLNYGDEPVSIKTSNLIIDAVHIPHSGWPTARTDVQNIAFRITLDDDSTVLHLGDSDARTVHFEADEDYWEEIPVDLALPPYWWFSSPDGIELLESRIDVNQAIGIHVPDSLSNPSNRPDELQGYQLFTLPGETRRFQY